MLRSVKSLDGCTVAAVDGDIGHIEQVSHQVDSGRHQEQPPLFRVVCVESRLLTHFRSVREGLGSTEAEGRQSGAVQRKEASRGPPIPPRSLSMRSAQR